MKFFFRPISSMYHFDQYAHHQGDQYVPDMKFELPNIKLEEPDMESYYYPITIDLSTTSTASIEKFINNNNNINNKQNNNPVTTLTHKVSRRFFLVHNCSISRISNSF